MSTLKNPQINGKFGEKKAKKNGKKLGQMVEQG